MSGPIYWHGPAFLPLSSFMQGERGDEAELLDLTGRLDQHAAHEIAGTIVPHPAPAAAASTTSGAVTLPTPPAPEPTKKP